MQIMTSDKFRHRIKILSSPAQNSEVFTLAVAAFICIPSYANYFVSCSARRTYEMGCIPSEYTQSCLYCLIAPFATVTLQKQGWFCMRPQPMKDVQCMVVFHWLGEYPKWSPQQNLHAAIYEDISATVDKAILCGLLRGPQAASFKAEPA